MSSNNHFVDESFYQDKINFILDLAKHKGATQAAVGARASEGLNVNVRLGEVDTIEFNKDKSIGVTLYCNQKKGSASTTDLSESSLKATVEAAWNIAQNTEADPFSGLAEANSLAKEFHDLELYHPWSIEVEQAKALALECEKSALNVDKRITNSEGACVSSSQSYHIYGNSNGFIGGYFSSLHSISCVVIGEENGMQRDYQYSHFRDAKNLLPAEQVGREAAWRTLQRLNPRKIKTQSLPVLFHSSVASSLIKHFLSAIEGAALYREASFLMDTLDKQVFNANIQMHEKPFLKGGLGSAPFDSEGVAIADRTIVQNGLLQSYLLNSYSARKLKVANTGHAGGIRNLFVHFKNLSEEESRFESLLKTMGTGLMVTEVMGPGVNLVTGDYSRGASGYWIENGEIQFPVQEITIAGNLKDIYQRIIGIAQDDVDYRHVIQTGSILVESLKVAGAS